MTETELIQNLNSLFGSDRSELRKKLIEVRESVSQWERLGRALRTNVRQPINVNPCFFEDTFSKLDDPKADMFWVGDCSYYYEILLNPGIKSGLDWDKRLALKCGGTAKLCIVWASVLLPYYAIDCYCMKYKTKPDEFEFTPYIPSAKKEKHMLSQVRDVMRENGFTRMPKTLAKRKVPKAITDCREKGKATVFDCLFSDTQCYQEHFVRFTDSTGKNPIAGVYPGTTVGWRERLGRKGGVIERYTWREYPSGDTITTFLDKKFRVTEIRVSRGGTKSKQKPTMLLDIKKKKLTERTW